MTLQDEPVFKRRQLLHSIELAGPAKTAPFIVKQFFSCLCDDVYPEKDYEQVFGVQMVEKYIPPDLCDIWIGKLTYGAWQTLFNNDYITETDVIDALWQGTLPDFFQQKIIKVYNDFMSGETDANGCMMHMSQYVSELLKRGFSDIPWDLEVHKLLFKKVDSQEVLPNKTVPGLRIEVDQITSEDIQMDSSFEKIPIAAAAGIPLFVKKLPLAGNQVHIGRRYIIVRMMSEPRTGLAPVCWCYGGAAGPAPPVLVARSDSVPFTQEDWMVLDDFENNMLDDGPRKVTRKDFVDFANEQRGNANIVLEALFPKGQWVRIVGLKTNVTLNEKMGLATGKYGHGRVAIRVDGIDNPVSVKPENLMKIAKKK